MKPFSTVLEAHHYAPTVDGHAGHSVSLLTKDRMVVAAAHLLNCVTARVILCIDCEACAAVLVGVGQLAGANGSFRNFRQREK